MTKLEKGCKQKYNWTNFLENEELGEIYASLDDSDRYIIEGLKDRLKEEARKELIERGLISS